MKRLFRAPVSRVALALIVCFAVAVLVSTRRGSAANPASPASEQVLTAGGPPVTFGAGPFLVPNPTDQATGVPLCNAALPCSDFTLNVDVPAGYENQYYVKVQVNWTNPAAQYDTFVFESMPDGSAGKLLAANFFAVNPDVATIAAVSGKYLVRVSPTIPLGDSFTGKATLEQKVGPAPQGGISTPTFQNFQAPSTLGNGSGEPSIGVALPTAESPQGRAMYQSGTQLLRVTFNDGTTPTQALWESKSAPNAQGSLDPILFTDRQTGRTFTSQLAGACSKAAYTDTAAPFNDGDVWAPSQGCGFPAGVDHQTMGGGPLHAPLTTGAAYPNGVYYCSQYGTQAAACALSVDGGLTFGPAIPIYTVSCFGIHGHVKVAPDGTVYVPDSDCSSAGAQTIGDFPTATARQALVFSEDNGITWSQPQLVPDSNPAPGIVDPSIGIGANGTIYYGYANSNGAPSVAVGHLDKTNHKIAWNASQDVGTPFGIKNVTFPAMVAGDDDRAAFAFMGTPTSGYYQDYTNFSDNTGFAGVWHLYIAYTYDGGASWMTVDATPNDPVQRGSICNSGTVICSRIPDDRNLLDFMDATVDHQGRVLVAYPDGCITQACIQGGANDYTKKATIARQSGGKGLFAAFDGSGATPTPTPTPSPTPTPTPTATPTPTPCPHSGILTPAGGSLSYCGGPFSVSNPSSPIGETPPACASGTCDQYALTVNIPSNDTNSYKVKVTIDWTNSDSSTTQLGSTTDYDVFVYQPDEVTGAKVGQGGGSDHPEVADFRAATGTKNYTIYVVPYDVQPDVPFTATIALTQTPITPEEPKPVAASAGPRYHEYAPPTAVGENSGEPSIGYNLTTHHAMYLAGLQTLQVTFPERIDPIGSVPESGLGSWKDVSYVWTKTRSLDPILFTDQRTGRTFVSQLNSEGAGPALIGLNSLLAYTDDDGATWTPAQVNPPDGSNDHQTVGAGPYPASVSLGNDVNKGDAVYYCGQSGNVLVATSTAFCSRSDDGGLNFGKSVPIYLGATGDCSQMIHGHVKVAPDGTVYVPNAQCGGQQGVAVSTDAGTTWTVRTIPDSLPGAGGMDPSVGIASDNTVYFAYTGAVPGGNAIDAHIFVAVSTDRGEHWSNSVDVGSSRGIKNAAFPSAVAGDPNRAAVAFLGTTIGGDHQDVDFKGTWYGFVAHTFDRGATWTTALATPNGPVQRNACIWNGGGNNPCRNLLDFNDVTMDEKGQVLFAFADGCIDGCESGGANTYSSKATIARQSGGPGLLAQFDPQEPRRAQRPFLSGRRDDMASYLQWAAPDAGGSAISLYKIYRGTVPGSEVYIGKTSGDDTDFVDRGANPEVTTYYYKVTAVNAVGEGLPSNIVALVVKPRLETEGACTQPGVTAIMDPVGDESDGLGQHDITSVSVAEPENMPGKLVITIKVVDLKTVPPGWRWAVRFGAPQNPPDVTGLGPQEDWFVSMVTSDGAAPTFTYGSTSVPQSASRIFTTIGNLDQASNANADGTITLVLPKSAIGNPTPGQAITGMLGSVRATLPSTVPGSGGTNETIPDSTGGGAYNLRPENLCLPNTAPIAHITADRDRGDSPLTVQFDGSSSTDADAIDSIASYTFNFGDGGDDFTQAAPVVVHTFMEPGEFEVRMVVKDSRGKISANTAHYIVEAEGAQPTPTPTPTPTSSPTPTSTPTPTPTSTPTPTATPSATPTPTATPSPTDSPSATPTPTPSPTPPALGETTVQFSSAKYSATEGCVQTIVTVNRSGPVDGATSVRFFAENGTATQRGDYTFSARSIRFSPGETTKQVPVLISDDAYAEGMETAFLKLADVRGGSLGPITTSTLEISDNDTTDGSSNPIDDPVNFVGEHYHDFLNRQSDPDGQQFWAREITSCGGDQQCIDAKRVNVSAAFYLSIEFQQTGYLVERIYKASYGDAQATSNWNGNHQLAVPIIRLDEFLPDTQQIAEGVTVGKPGWEQAIEKNTQAFSEDFVQRSRFTAAFPSTMTPAAFVDQLNRNAGNPLSSAERDQLVSDLSSGAKTRAQVLRAVAEDPDLSRAEFNRAFVLMQYFGYLRRNPNNAPDADYTGFDFWLTKLNSFNGDFAAADMVKAFINSTEYRERFQGGGTRGNQLGSVAKLQYDGGKQSILLSLWFSFKPSLTPVFASG